MIGKAHKYGHIIKECPVCGKNFRTFPSINCTYCSRKCSNIGNRHPRKHCLNCGKELCFNAKGNLCRVCNQKSKAVKVNQKCQYCGRGFETRQWKINQGKAKFYSVDCKNQALKFLAGDKSSRWKGGLKPRYQGKFWNVICIWAKDKAKNQCERCGKISKLHVHHKKPFIKCQDVFQASMPNNLEVLCMSCHAKTEGLGKIERR